LRRCRRTTPRTGNTDVEASSSSRLEIAGSTDTRPVHANSSLAASSHPPQSLNLPQPPVELVPTGENVAHHVLSDHPWVWTRIGGRWQLLEARCCHRMARAEDASSLRFSRRCSRARSPELGRALSRTPAGARMISPGGRSERELGRKGQVLGATKALCGGWDRDG